ncbi:phage head spike fiber domain-containing protein [Falsiroseomonas sp.]|uniref:phage head spike fiber domain-containing protein n=1 Tax=Falsiroseomonas sp. TaxID=2870721 RepID=UPI003F6EE102
MSTPLFSALGSLAPPWRHLPMRAALPPGVALARAQVSSRSTVLEEDGQTFAEVLADLPRFSGPARRLLLEGQRSNALRNPRGEGGTPGSSALPTNWTSVIAGGLSRTYLEPRSEAGLQGPRLRLEGTASGSSSTFALEGTTQIAAAQGQSWTFSASLRLVSGTPGTISMRMICRDAGGVSVSSPALSAVVPTGDLIRFERSFVLPADAAIAFLQPALQMSMVTGQAYDVVLDVLGAQVERGGFASTPILPAPGAPAASTRGADLASVALASLGLGGACTLLWSGLLPQLATAEADQTLLQLDNGTDSHRISLRNLAPGGGLVAGRVLAGAAADSPSLGSITPGTPFRAALAIGGGRVAASLEGGTVQVVTDGPASGLTTLRIGNNAANTAALFGQVGSLAFLPFAVPDAALPGLVTTLPL